MAKSKQQRKQIRQEGKQQLINGINGMIINSKDKHTSVNVGGDTKMKGSAGYTITKVDTGKKRIGRAKAANDIIQGVGKVLFNHPQWYENVDLNGLVGANFATRKNVPDDNFYSFSSAEYEDTAQKHAKASTCRIGLRLTIPHTNSNGYQQAVQIMYNRIRSANSGSVNYSVNELSYYVHAVRSLRAVYCILRRAYATLTSYNAYDGNLPQAFFASMGLDYDTFKDNAALVRQLGTQINAALTNLAPLDINLFDRTDWLLSNIFADSDDVKASYYLFSLQEATSFTYVNGSGWSITDITLASPFSYSGAGLTVDSTGLTWDDFKDSVNTIFNSFISNERFAIVAGDILKAYGNAALYKQDDWSVNFNTPIIFDEAALTQIQNAVVMGNSINVKTTDVLSDSGHLYTDVSISRLAGPGSTQPQYQIARYLKHPYINSYKNTLTSGELLSSTRLIIQLDEQFDISTWTSSNDIPYTMLYYGTEVITGMAVIYLTDTSPNLYKLQFAPLGYGFAANEDNTPFNEYSMWSQLDYAPLTSFLDCSDGEVARNMGIMFDFNVYANLTNNMVASYHDYAALSLLAVTPLLRASNKVDLDIKY